MATATSTKLTTKPRKILLQWQQRNPDPTPEEIRERCAAIRATWSEADRLRRLAVQDVVEWRPPVVAESELPLDVSRDF